MVFLLDVIRCMVKTGLGGNLAARVIVLLGSIMFARKIVLLWHVDPFYALALLIVLAFFLLTYSYRTWLGMGHTRIHDIQMRPLRLSGSQ